MANVHEAAEEATSEVISEAMAWCMEARKLLGLGPPATTGNGEAKPERPVAKSAVRVAAALVEFRKEVKAKKKAAPTADLGSFESGMDAIAAGLKAAAEKKDAAGVAAQEANLAALKAEFAAAEAKTAAERLLFNTALSAATTEIDGIDNHGETAAIKDKLGAIKGDLATARSHAKGGDYAQGTPLLEKIPKLCEEASAAAKAIAEQHAAYDTVLQAATAAITAIDKHGEAAAIKEKLDTIKSDLTTARGHAKSGDYAQGTPLLEKIPALCEDATATAKAVAEQHAAYDTALQAAEAAIAAIDNHGEAGAIKEKTDDIAAKLAAAKGDAKNGDYAPGTLLLDKIPALCEEASAAAKAIAEQHAAYNTALQAAEAAIAAIDNHGQEEAIQDQKATISGNLSTATGHGDTGAYEPALPLLLRIPELCLAATAAAKKAAEKLLYDTALSAAEAAIAAIVTHGEAAAIKAETDVIAAKLATAKGHGASGDHAQGTPLLGEIPALCTAATAAALAAKTAHDKYTADLAVLKGKYDPCLAHAQHSFVEDDLKAVNDKMAEAAGLVTTAHDYSGACDRLADGLATCDPLSSFMDVAKRAVDDVIWAQGLVTTIDGWSDGWKDLYSLGEMKTNLRQAKDKLAADKKKASEHDLAAADDFIKKIADRHTTGNSKFDAYNTYLGLHPGRRADIANLKSLKGPAGMTATIAPNIATIEAKFAAAEAKVGATPPDPAAANVLLEEIPALYTAATGLASTVRSYFENRPFCLRDLEYLKKHPQKATIQVELAAIAVLNRNLKAKETAKDYKAAATILNQMYGEVYAAQISADNLEYPDAKTRAAASIATLNGHTHKAGISGELGPIDLKFAEAEKLFTAGNITRAMEMINEVEVFCKQATAIADRFGAYDTAMKAQTTRVAALKALGHPEVIEARLKIIEANLGEAKKKAEGRDHEYLWATSILKTVEGDCKAAEAILKDHIKELAEAKKVTDEFATDPEKAVAATRALFEKLKTHAHKDEIKDSFSGIDTLIKDAKKLIVAEKPDEAKIKLEEAVKACIDQNLIADRHGQYLPALKAATDLEVELKALDNATAPDKTSIKNQLAAAVQNAKDKKYGDAIAQLEKIAKECKDLIAKAKMLANLESGTPDVDKLKELVNQPGGAAVLDEMIKNMDATTSRKLLKAALEARFDMTVEMLKADWTEADLSKSAPNMKQLYTLMAAVPRSHTQLNPKMAKIQRYGGTDDQSGTGNYYQASGGLVSLSCGRDTAVGTSPHGTRERQNNELDITANSPNLLPDDTVPEPSYSSWTILHEIGHTLDDKQSFMNGKAGNTNFGGWLEHGGDVSKVAEAIQIKCGYKQAWIKGYLLGNAGAEPADEANPLDQAAWDAKRDKAKAWCDAIRTDKNLWGDKGGCASHVCADGRVYHEAYSGVWVSYVFSTRSRGVTGYQFRAPGEWFSELYAAYATKKMRPGHPDYGWLDAL